MSNKKLLEKYKIESFNIIYQVNSILRSIRESDYGFISDEKSLEKEGIEKTDKKIFITRVVLPKEGGVLTYYSDTDHPFKGFNYGETVEAVDEVKKMLMAVIYGFFENLFKNKIKAIIGLIFLKREIIEMIKEIIIKADFGIRRVRQKPNRYCQAVRDVFSTATIVADRYAKDGREKQFFYSMRNLMCMILEYDDAYRYPFQDIVSRLDKKAARKNIVKELKRLIDIYLKKDHRGTDRKFKVFRKLLFLLHLNRRFKKMITDFFVGLDLEKVKLDDDDKYYAKMKKNYDWDF